MRWVSTSLDHRLHVSAREWAACLTAPIGLFEYGDGLQDADRRCSADDLKLMKSPRMGDLAFKSATELGSLIDAGATDPLELTRIYLARAEGVGQRSDG